LLRLQRIATGVACCSSGTGALWRLQRGYSCGSGEASVVQWRWRLVVAAAAGCGGFGLLRRLQRVVAKAPAGFGGASG